jgi:hypothetical protein
LVEVSSELIKCCNLLQFNIDDVVSHGVKKEDVYTTLAAYKFCVNLDEVKEWQRGHIKVLCFAAVYGEDDGVLIVVMVGWVTSQNRPLMRIK